jgi:predicted ATPase
MRRVDRLALSPLGARASAELVRAVLGGAVKDDAVAHIVERAGGNALFLEQLVRAYAEGTGDTTPASVLAMLQARFDALPAEQRRILRAASIFGRSFWREGVHALLGMLAPEPALGGWLRELADRELVIRSRAEGAAGLERWIFRHDLLRDAAFAGLPEDERVLGHRLAARWLEEAGVGDAPTLAAHFQAGGVPARAAPRWVEAAEAALQANDLEAAGEHVERAISCGAVGADFGLARSIEAEICRFAGETERGVTAGREAVRLLPVESVRWYTALGILSSMLGRLGRTDELRDVARLLLVPPAKEKHRAWVGAAARTAINLFGSRDQDLAE